MFDHKILFVSSSAAIARSRALPPRMALINPEACARLTGLLTIFVITMPVSNHPNPTPRTFQPLWQ
jgi:hypothetical protein